MKRILITMAIFMNTFATSMAFFQPTNVVVDGISGEITYPDGPIPILYPKDKVKVILKNINLVHYAYKISIGQEELKMAYPIVGVGDGFVVQSSDSESFVQDEEASEKSLEAISKGRWAPEDFIKVFDRFEVLKMQSNALIKRVNATIAVVETAETRVNQSHLNYQPAIDTFNKKFCDHLADFQKYNSTLAALRTYYDRLVLLISLGVIQPPESFNLSQLGLNSKMDNLRTSLSNSYAGLLTTQKQVQHWESILAAHPSAQLTQSFTVGRGNHRYTIQILRKPVTASAQAALQTQFNQGIAPPEGGDEKKAESDYQVLASFSYEGHTRHRFNLSVGLAYLDKQDDRTFAVQETPNDADGLDYFLREATSEQQVMVPVAQLGMYFKPFDPFDPQDKVGWMFNLGTEISDKPDYYFAGLSMDTHWGMTVGFGIFTYEGTELAEGWQLGDSIAVDTMSMMPIISDIPTQKSTELGSYVHLSFRPSIFKKFWAERGGK